MTVPETLVDERHEPLLDKCGSHLDENRNWPTHGTYEYTSYYHSRREIVSFTEFIAMDKEFDFVVIGAGPIGAALAFKLARDNPNSRVLVVEKNWAEPDRIVGELMQPGGCQAIEQLGLRNVFSDICAVPVHGYYISYRGRQLHVPYMHDTNGQLRGVSFHHGRLVMNLRAACKAQSNVVCVEGSVTELLGQMDNSRFTAVRGVRVGPQRIRADGSDECVDVCSRKLTFVCDGITSQFRKQLNERPVELISHFCGLVLEHEPVSSDAYFDGPTGATSHVSRPTDTAGNPLPMPHNGNVMLDGVGPVLLYQMSERETRVLADIPGPFLPSESNGQLRETLRVSLSRAAPKHLYPGLHAALMRALNDSRRIRCIGSKFIPATANNIDGAVWIGDALNVRHPLTGGGMTVGLWDVVILTDLLRSHDAANSQHVQRVKAQWQWRRRPRALVVNVLSVALHALFAAETKELGLLREACFEYLAKGGRYTMQPSGFLSGLVPSPMLLIFHFFSVAFLAVYLRVSDSSVAYSGGSLVYRVYSAFYTLYIAATVILPVIWRELQP
ncbi:Squalene epoxidase [Coemansia sp. RSA 678]|nr:Squalene epoxidase [Coemansia sp. RSA 678]